ncbi:hypothetical protein Rsub_04371 [Raphidocelis subcapitata]|uniref:HYR domain-containing protein n=1 Tax=Raphidocelis subcapitata TaxID=307507 RepID=A0A2V0NVI0_9CHLO|nr:hypothetical protein Rsub_04371 [Raphidocelis subcapitata]|eukprot:GBF91631.1 hypothetical protein Rsub_04371 [Raphidocelis subcapitata]
MARAATLLLVLCAAGPAAASRSPSALLAGYGSAGRSLLQDQTSCCALVDATATGGTMTCGPSGLLLTAPSVQFAPIAASISVTGKSGNTAAMTTTALYPQTCSSRFGAATWGMCTLLLSLKVDATCDPTPPVFDPALEDISVDATSAAGAVVTYAPTANDDGAPVTVTCDPASGSQFVIGTTPVTCTAGVTTGTFNVIVAVAAPAFAANAPTTPFEANTNTPYVGANLSGLYTPSASDPVDGDLSASIETFLVSNDEQISLSGVDAYIFPLGSTQIKNTVTNSFGVSSEEFVTIVVVGTTKPVVTVATPLQILVTQPRSAPPKTVNYADKCTATGVATPITITYSPPSGSRTGTTFPVGQTTTVTCTATDAAGNTATGTFTVRVRRPPGQEDGRK